MNVLGCLEMFTKSQIEAVIISLAYPEISIEKDDNQSIGYRIRLRVHFRAINGEFLMMLKESLKEIGIDSYYKEIEKESRPYPLLRITRVDNLIEFCNLIPEDLPHSNDKFGSFQEILTIVSNKHHLTQKGFERVLEIKGLSI